MVTQLPSCRDFRRSRDSAGFSLIELVIALGISVTALSAVVMITSQVERSYNTQLDGASIQQEARYALETIAETLRTAGSNPYLITVSACPAAGTAFQAIRRDPNGNGVNDDIRLHADVSPPNGLLGGAGGGNCTEAGEDLTIAHDPAARTITLRDNNTQAAALPVTDSIITALQFTYLDANRVVTANDAAVAFVQVSVTAQARAVERGRLVQFTLTSEARVRAR